MNKFTAACTRLILNEERSLTFEKTEQVSSYQCDFNLHLKPAVLFQYMTEAASGHTEQLGCGFENLHQRNYYWVLSRLKIQFFDFPVFEEKITIHTWAKTVQQKIFFIRDFEVLAASGARLAAATSAWLIIDASTRRMVPTAAARLDLPALPEKQGVNSSLEKIGLRGGGEERLKVKARYSVVDMQGHVNNSRYIEWICDCFPLEQYRTHTLEELQINYNHEILPGEEVALLVNQPQAGEESYTVEGLNRSNGTQAFECSLHWRGR